eukprot:Platyproteum_vivax@DN7361_c0_g1_i11.p1
MNTTQKNCDQTIGAESQTQLCANNCGYYGNPANDNLCSKCYQESKPAVPMSDVVKDEAFEMCIDSARPSVNVFPSKIEEETIATETDSGERMTECSTATTSTNAASDPEQKPPRAKNKCWTCNKRVGLVGFTCRCDNMFCQAHRLPEIHECTFDHKTFMRKGLEEANPEVIAKKVNKI